MRNLKLIAAFLLLATAHANAQVYNIFQPGGALNGSWNSQNVNLASGAFIQNQLPLTNVASIANSTILGNASGSSSAPQALNPLAVATMMSAVLAVDVISTSNISLSGLQTIDGISLQQGQFVLVQGQTTSSQNGIYVVASSAWSRAANFPSGYVLAQNCEVVIRIRSGNTYGGRTFALNTSSGSLTIGTSALSFAAISDLASATKTGIALLGAAPSSTGAVASAGTVATANDCMSWQSTTNAIAIDVGDANSIKGPCAVESATTAHLILQNGGIRPTASVGTLNTNSTDHWGIVTALSGATTETITFAGSFTNTPACTANDSQAATPVAVTAISATAVTFGFSALTGALYYTCFGTN